MRTAAEVMRRRDEGIAFCNEAIRRRAEGTVQPVIDDPATRRDNRARRRDDRSAR
jgi:hypothetical protein